MRKRRLHSRRYREFRSFAGAKVMELAEGCSADQARAALTDSVASGCIPGAPLYDAQSNMQFTADGAALAAELIEAEADLADAVIDRFGAPIAVVLATEADAEALIRDLGGECADLTRRVRNLRAAFREAK